jgi:hypothetical protein
LDVNQSGSSGGFIVKLGLGMPLMIILLCGKKHIAAATDLVSIFIFSLDGDACLGRLITLD